MKDRRKPRMGHLSDVPMMPPRAAWALIALFHAFPMLVTLYGFALFWDRLHYNSPALQRTAVVVALREDWPIVVYTTNAGDRHEAEVDEPPTRPIEVGDRVTIRYHGGEPGRAILYDGPSDLWLAPGAIIGIGVVVNLLVLIASLNLLPR